ncbi:hypothetical protein SDC9_202863 [bioreactor metagenome]|uniref:Uncharacterized protein n=1 Tax=bioreactor metagenome TaxID=1076179 RepID=A0A645J3W0_9ZZZZ
MTMGNKRKNPVDGAAEIIGIYRGKITTHSDIPRIQKAPAADQLLPQF